MSVCGAENEANGLMDALTADVSFEIPEIDLSGPDFKFPVGLLDKSPTPLTIADVTNGSVTGPGAFDALMRGFKAHLTEEYEAGRITGDDYTKAYIALTESAMSQGIVFLLGRDSAYWQAIATQVSAFTARVAMETAKVQLAGVQFEALGQKANYALTKMRLGTEEITYCTGKYNLDQMLPQQLKNLENQGDLVKEQTEAQRAQTLDTRSDGVTVTGTTGKQKELYSQQIVSYQRNSEVAAAKIFSDAWITQKTLDDGLQAPVVFQNANVDKVMSRVQSANNLT